MNLDFTKVASIAAAPFTGGASLVGLGLSVGADLYGARQARQGFASQAARNYEQEKEFATHGIRWRVEDAKAAGLHPLYGASGNTPSPSAPMYLDPMGQAINNSGRQVGQYIASREMAALAKAQLQAGYQRELNDMAMSHVMLEREHMLNQAMFQYSENGNAIGLKPPALKYWGLDSQPDAFDLAGPKPYVNAEPATPAFKPYNFHFGPMLLMKSKEGPTESFDVGLDGRMLTIAANIAHYGPSWKQKMLRDAPSWLKKWIFEFEEQTSNAKTGFIERAAPLIIKEIKQ